MRKIIKVSIVVPAYNEEKLIERCLQSLSKQTMKRSDYEIIVVDNNSTDNTNEIAQKYADRVIVEKRKGVLFARQTGFEAARSEYILRTDSDCVVPKNWIRKGYKFLKGHKNISAVSGFYYPDNEDKVLVDISWWLIQYKNLMYKTKGSIEWLTGSCSGFKKSCFMEAGGFDLNSDPVIEDQQGIAYRLNKIKQVAFNKDWWVWYSTRRVESRRRQGLKTFADDYLLYQIFNNLYFFMFKKKPEKIKGNGWKDIRE